MLLSMNSIQATLMKITKSINIPIIITIVSAIAIAAYWPIYQFEYVWDDSVLFWQLNARHDSFLTTVQDIFSSHFFASENYYRPLTQLSFTIEMNTWQGNAGFSHIINLALHILNINILAFILYKKLPAKDISQRNTVIFIGLIFYAIHPALSENIAWVSGRFDLMLTSFLLMALAFDCFEKNTTVRCIGVGCMFFLAALCKEMALSLALTLPLWHILLDEDKNLKDLVSIKKTYIKVYASIFFFGLLYLLIRYLMLGYLINFNENPLPQELPFSSLLQHKLSIFLKSIYLYSRQLFVPFSNMSPLYEIDFPLKFNDNHVIYGAVIFTILIIGSFIKAIPTAVRLTYWAVFLAFIPVLNLAPLKIGNNVIQNRFIIFPLCIFILFFCITYTQLIVKERMKYTRQFIMAFLLWCGLSFSTLMSIIPLWRSDLSLWSWAILYSDNPATRINYAGELIMHGKASEALQQTSKIHKPYGAFESSVYSIEGQAYYQLNQLDQAVKFLEKSIALPNTYNNWVSAAVMLANIKMDQGNLKNLEIILKKSVNLLPNYTDSHIALSRFYFLNPIEQEKAISYANSALKSSKSKDQYNNALKLLISYGFQTHMIR